MSPAHINNKMAVAKKKQWQRYIDDSLMKTNQVSMAAIHALDGTQWASSDELQVSGNEAELFTGYYGNYTGHKGANTAIGGLYHWRQYSP